MYECYDYDYKCLKKRLYEEIDCVLKHDHWKYEHVKAVEELLDCVKHVEEIEKLEYEEWMREWSKEHPESPTLPASVTVKK